MNTRLIELRKSLGLKQDEFAKKLGFSQSNLSYIEKGKIPLTEANIRLICLTFGVNREWLVNGTGDMMDDEAHLNDREKRLLELFRGLSPRARTMLIEYAEKPIADEAELKSAANNDQKGEQSA